VYAFFGIFWIFLSDTALAWFSADVHSFKQYALLKGSLFILCTSGLIFLLIKRYQQEAIQCRQTCQSSQLQAKNEIEQLIHYDRETGLPNQNLLMDRLNQIIALNSRERRKSAVIYISLTSFKGIVDTLGHHGIGEVMLGISAKIAGVLRQYDTLSRIHRDEFVIVLGGSVQEGDLSVILSKLQHVFATPIPIQNLEVAIPACMGVACYPADGPTAETLLQNAHIAMNQARLSGMASQFYSESMNRKAIERFGFEAGMIRAIDDGELFLCYQPKIELYSSTIIGMEALVRWRRSATEVITPDKFIPVAEDTGLIVRLGTWVLREACRQNKEWQDAGLPPLCVSVNISARQLRESLFVEHVEEILESSGLPPKYLELELTETAIMIDSEETVQKLLRLKKLGISISVDDFGTGYSSLSYLKHLPIDTIKVDRSFVRDIVSDPDDAAIVDAIVAMAHALNLRIVAEGVETIEQLEFLRNKKCHSVQGYYFSRPLEAGVYETFLRNWIAEGSSSEAKIAYLPTSDNVTPPSKAPMTSTRTLMASAESIGDISILIVPAHPNENLIVVLKRFQNDPNLRVLPVVESGRVVGVLNRYTFLEEHVIGMHGFGFHINHSRKLRDLMNSVFMTLETATTIRDAAQMIQSRNSDILIDNVCVTNNGLYEGVVDVNRFINAITEINLTLAKGANPLTGLPGNESIQREITNRLKETRPFDIVYIDIDNFKPYNDFYGFQKGDVVIKAVGEIITNCLRSAQPSFANFCGHIGGDDFIVIVGSHCGQNISQLIIHEFEEHLPVFHGAHDFSAGCYTTPNRKGQPETYLLLALSIGIVNTMMTPVESYAQLASLSSEVKKAAKMIVGSSVVVNRRNSLPELVTSEYSGLDQLPCSLYG